MSEAIRTGSFTNGFMRGMGAVDQHQDRKQRRELQREAVEMRKEDRSYQREQSAAAAARQEEAIKLQRENLEFNRARLGASDERAQQQHAWKTEDRRQAEKQARLKALSTEAGQYFHLLEQGAYESLDPDQLLEFHEKATAAGRPTLSPLSWDNETVSRVKKLGPLLQQLESGNLEFVNSPGNLKILSDLPGWKEKLNMGVGEQGRNGATIVGKELAELKVGPEGRVVPMLRVHTEDGDSYVAEMSAFRSSDPNEPVVAADAGKLLDNAMGQYMLANLFSNPEVQQRLSSVRGQLFGTDKPKELSSTGKTIRDLMSYGVTQDEAIKLSTQSKQDPQAAVLSLTKAIISGGYADDPKQAMEQARDALSIPAEEPEAPAPKGAGDKRFEDLFKKLRANPNNKGYTDDQLREALRQKLQA